MRNHDELDLLIDAALATYADPGPGSELARRVLDRMAEEPAHAPRRRWLPWVFALPAAACLLLVFFVHPRQRIVEPQSGHADQVAHLQKPGVLISRTAPHLAPPRVMAQRAITAAFNPPSAALAGNSKALPKLDVFPTPEPLSPQERALAVLAARTPQPELRALAQSQQQDVPLTVSAIPLMQEVPLTIASIHVMPLESPDKGEN